MSNGLFKNRKILVKVVIIILMIMPSWLLLKASVVYYNNINFEKILLTPPCYIIRVAEVQELNDAIGQVSKLTELGYQSGYIWRPDYRSLEGSQSYYVYIGPFQSVQSCESFIDKYFFEEL